MMTRLHRPLSAGTAGFLTAALLGLGGTGGPAVARQNTLSIDLAGAGRGTGMSAEQPLPSSFFLAGARHGVEHSGTVAGFSLAGAFDQIYPGMTLAVYVDEHHVEYAFLLAEGADPSRIRLLVNGVTFESMTAEGHVIYAGDGVEVYQRAPAIFRTDGTGHHRPVDGRLTLVGAAASSVSMAAPDGPEDERLDGVRFHIVPADSGSGGPGYDFFLSPFEITNEQWIRFLNDAQLNNRNPRGENMFFDEAGNVWINPAMQPRRDELFTLPADRIRYHPDRAPGDRYVHVMDDKGHPPHTDHPATGISWYGAVKYCNWLTLQSGRGPNEVCYGEGTNAWDWAPVTATNWANGFFTAEERRAWLDRKGFRLPMSRLYDPENKTPTNAFNEFLKAGAWNGFTNVLYGYGRNTTSPNDANTVNTHMTAGHHLLPVGYFSGLNPLLDGKALFNENAFGIHDMTGNVAEWLNDPGHAGVPDSRSLAGGSFQDRLRPLTQEAIVPPYATGGTGGFRPATTFMPASWTQVNILFCFHSIEKLPPALTERFGIIPDPKPETAPTPAEIEEPALLLIPGADVAPEPTEDVDLPGILYKEPSAPDPLEPDIPPPQPPPVGPSGPGQPLPPGPPLPPPPLFLLDVYSLNPDDGVEISISTADYFGRRDGETVFNRQYEFGTLVTLSAPVSVGGNVFQYWLRDGVPFETSPVITLQILSHLQLTAVYVSPVPPAQRTLVVDSTPGQNVPVVISRPDNNGQQDGSTLLSRVYDHRTSVTVTAPDAFNGDPFLGWLRNGIPFSSHPAVTVEMLSNITLTARYGQSITVDERSLTVTSINPDGGVPVSVSTSDLSGQQDGNTSFNRRYAAGEQVTLTAPAVAPDGNLFVRWLRNGSLFSNSETVSFTLQTDLILTAEYAPPPPPVTLTVQSANPNGGVTIAIGTPDNNNETDGNTTFSRLYDVNSSTTVTAPLTAPNGNEFRQWVLNGTAFSTHNAISLSLPANAELTAVYQQPAPPPVTRILQVASLHPDSGVTIAVSLPDIHTGETDGATAFNRTYLDGAEISLTAPAAAPNGHVFAHWLVDGILYSNQGHITLMMTANRTVTAVYEPAPAVRHLLTVESRNPNSTILVTVDPADVNSQQNGSTPFTRLYDDGVTVALTARNPAFPGSPNVFRQWEINGTPVSTNVTITVFMWQDTTATAVYGPAPVQTDRTLTVRSLNPDSGVAVSISAPDINTAETDGITAFDRLYGYGTNVVVAAPNTAPNGYLFSHWLLDGIAFSPDATLTLTMLSDMHLTAVYEPPPVERTLTVHSRNPGSGVGIQVGTQDNRGLQNGNTTFQRFYDDGETVTLTAPVTAPNGRDVFQRWERDGIPVTTNNTVDVSLLADIGMTAVYGPPDTFNLTVRSENPGSSVPIEISPPDVLGRTDGTTLFVRTYNPGTDVTVTAPETTPAGTVFQYWLRNGIGFSNNRSVDISMLADMELTAVYGPPVPVNRSLVIRSDNPDSNVPIEITPSDTRGLGNGLTGLQRIYPDGESVTFTAPASVGTNAFRQWILNGSPLSTNLTETITMLQDHELIAVYGPSVQPQERVLTVDSRNPFSGVPVTVSQPDINGRTDGDTVFVRIYNYGDSTTLTAPEFGGTNNTDFLRWELDGQPYSENRTVTLEMLSDARLTAVYGERPRDVTLTVESRNPDSGVVISVAPGDLNSETTGATTFERIYEYGRTVTLSAPPTTTDNRPFLHWLYNGVAAISTNPVYSVNMLGDLTMTAVYGDPPPVVEVTLTVRSRGPDGVMATLIGATSDNNNTAGGTTEFQRIYDSNTAVTLSAPATSNGFNFHHWEIGGAVFSSNQTLSLSMLENMTVTAVYVEPPPSVSGL